MQYEVFEAAAKWTQVQWNQRGNASHGPSYAELRVKGGDYWLHLENLDQDGLAAEVIQGFLNTPRWSCRLDAPTTCRGTEMVGNLHAALKQLPALSSSLQGIRIEDLVSVPELEPMLVDVTQIYTSFRGVKPRFGPVPASKLMHMALPSLFMMWDDSIIKGYSVPKEDLPRIGRKWSYAAFLLLMSENISHIRETYPNGLDLTYQQLIERINKDCGYANLPITRLLDIANFAVGEPIREREDLRKGRTRPSRGAPSAKCQRCLERTDSRMSRLVHYTRQFNLGLYT